MALPAGWLKQLQQEWVIPEITTDRCVHSQCEIAECTRCVDACPHDAWILADDSLQIAIEDCDGCGLCVAACTESALSQTLQPALRLYEGGKTLLFACEASGEKYAGDGVIPCLHVVPPSLLLQYYRNGYQQVLSCRGNCDTCPRYGGGDPFRERLAILNRILASRSAPPIKHAQLTPQAWAECRQKNPPLINGEQREEKASRRQFIRQAITFAVEKGMEQTGAAMPAENFHQPWPSLLPTGTNKRPPLYPFVPEIDPTKCNGCDACVKLCPHQALQSAQDENDGKVLAYQIHAENCTGCDICKDTCDQQAIRIRQVAPQQQEQILLTQTTCKACGSHFHYPANDETNLYCRICSQTNHHRNLFQVY